MGALVLGAHSLRPESFGLLKDAVIVNLEPFKALRKTAPEYLELLGAVPVLEYSPEQAAVLRETGPAAHLGIGWSDVLERVPPAEKDIDVLFYGSFSDRRRATILALRDAGVRVAAAFNAYGAERDGYVARAKVVLNLRYWEGNPFEAVRVSYLLNNRACVVSEESDDPVFEDFRAGLAAAPYDALVETCRRLVDDADERARLAEAGYSLLRARPQHVLLGRALAELEALGVTAGPRV